MDAGFPSRDDTAMISIEDDAALRDDTETIRCPVCGRGFERHGRRRYCSETCRKTAWRRRHQPDMSVVAVPVARSRKDHTVYECPNCETRLLGEQYCGECGVFCRRIGPGNVCPHCDGPVAHTDLAWL